MHHLAYCANISYIAKKLPEKWRRSLAVAEFLFPRKMIACDLTHFLPYNCYDRCKWKMNVRWNVDAALLTQRLSRKQTLRRALHFSQAGAMIGNFDITFTKRQWNKRKIILNQRTAIQPKPAPKAQPSTLQIVPTPKNLPKRIVEQQDNKRKASLRQAPAGEQNVRKMQKQDNEKQEEKLSIVVAKASLRPKRMEPSPAGQAPQLGQSEIQLGYVPGQATSSAPVPMLDWTKARPEDKPKRERETPKVKPFGLTASDKLIRQTNPQD